MSKSPYRVFSDWLFDGKPSSPIPRGGDLPDILKYNSPINHTYVISMFLTNGPLNKYLNTYFNNIGVRYLDKEELFRFIKTCVRDFKIKRKDIAYLPYKQKDEVFRKIKPKLPLLKNYDIDLLCDLINKSEEKNSIYSSLGIEKIEKKKLKEKKKKKKKVNLKEFLSENFATIEI